MKSSLCGCSPLLKAFTTLFWDDYAFFLFHMGPSKEKSEFICLQLKSEACKNTMCTIFFCFSVWVIISSFLPSLSSPLAFMCFWLVRPCMCEVWTEGSDSVFTTVCCALPVWAYVASIKWIVLCLNILVYASEFIAWYSLFILSMGYLDFSSLFFPLAISLWSESSAMKN